MTALPPNEPPTNLESNSSDLQELKAEIRRVQSETVEIPCIVGGKEVFTGNTRYQLAVNEQPYWLCFNISNNIILKILCPNKGKINSV